MKSVNVPGIDKVVPQGLMWDTIFTIGAVLKRTSWNVGGMLRHMTIVATFSRNSHSLPFKSSMIFSVPIFKSWECSLNFNLITLGAPVRANTMDDVDDDDVFFYLFYCSLPLCLKEHGTLNMWM